MVSLAGLMPPVSQTSNYSGTGSVRRTHQPNENHGSIQPSRFLGWSTTVQDAVTLGRPLVCSDIPIYREQIPAAMGFSLAMIPRQLAELLSANWEALTPLRDRSLASQREFALQHGKTLLKLCHRSSDLS